MTVQSARREARSLVGASALLLALSMLLSACSPGTPGPREPGSGQAAADSAPDADSTDSTGAAPSSFAAVTEPEQLIGRWQAPPPANQNAYIEFTEYGLWFSSDGCNGGSGTWGFDEGGEFVANGPGTSRLAGCHNVLISEAVGNAEHVEIGEIGGGSSELRIAPGVRTIDGEEYVLVRTRDEGVSLGGEWVGPGTTTSLTRVRLSDDGRFHISAPCGELAGEWTLEALDDEAFQASISDSLSISTGGRLRLVEDSGSAVCLGEVVPPATAHPSTTSSCWATTASASRPSSSWLRACRPSCRSTASRPAEGGRSARPQPLGREASPASCAWNAKSGTWATTSSKVPMPQTRPPSR